MLFVIFPLLLLIFYLSLIFVSLITMCLDVFLLGFILPGTLCAFWTYLTISFLMFRKFSAIISSNIFSGPFSLSYPSACLFFSSRRSLVNISCIVSIFASTLSQILDHLHSHYSEFFFWKVASASFSCFSGILSCPSMWDINFCFFIMINFLY